MSLNELTPVTIHTHTGDSTTFVCRSTPNEIKTLGTNRAADAVIGMAVLTGGTDVVVSATVTQVPYSFGYANSPGYARIQVTSIDDGVATTSTLSLGPTNETHLPGLRRPTRVWPLAWVSKPFETARCCARRRRRAAAEIAIKGAPCRPTTF
jgi:hypothetical protein